MITDNDGNYIIDVSPTATLQFSFIGMQGKVAVEEETRLMSC